MIKINIAGLTVAINNRFGHILRLARDYLTDADAELTVMATDEDIRKEREASDESFSDGYLESIVVYRKIAEQLPRFDAVVFHGAVLNMDGEAYAFTARSGVGKTTHTRLWLERFGQRVHYLNGDKPIIRFIDGVPYACGTPWQGKESYGVNETAPLRGIAFLGRAEENSAAPVPSESVVTRLMTQIYLPKESGALIKTMRLADRLVKSVRLVDLRCNMDISAAEVSYKALTGQSL